MQSNTDVDIKMIVPQLSLEIFVCGSAGVIFFVCLLAIVILSVRDRFKSQKNSDVSFSKL